MWDPVVMNQLLAKAKALGLPVQQLVDEYSAKAGSAIDAIKANPVGAAKHAGFGLAAGTAGTPMDIAGMVTDNMPAPAKFVNKLVQKIPGVPQQKTSDGKTVGGADWLLEKFAPKPSDEGESAAQFLGTVAAPSPQGVARNVTKTAHKIFGGIGAKTADLKELERAKKMEKAGGFSAEEIWRQTGWGRAPGDNQWRFEIDDSQAKLTGRKQGVAMNVLDHPELFKAYPELRNTWTNVDDVMSPGVRGSYEPNSVRVSRDAPDRRSVTLHEFQHGVQDKQGFTQGTSPTAMRNSFAPFSNDPETLAAADRMAHDLYMGNGGELEARITQRRQNLTAEERREAFPFKESAYGMDVPLENVHTMRGRGKPISASVDKTVAAPKEVKVAKRFKDGDKAGVYRGSEAFGGITPAKLGSMRAKYLGKMEAGAPGKYWYDNTSEDILRLVGGDTGRADDLANMLAVTSSRTPVGSNLMYAAKGWNQRAVGDPIRTGGFPNNMGKSIEETLSSPEGIATGLKRSPFSAGLSVKWRGEDFANRPVHDIHDVRAWGIVDPKTGEPWSKGVGDAGHRFLDEQGAWVTDAANKRELGGAADWTPYRSQAAAWIAQKAEKEGIPIEDAAKHYGDFIDQYSAHVTRSWIPGSNTGHHAELLDKPLDVQKTYSDALEEVNRGPQGIDRLASGMGALTDRVLPNAGLYEGKVEPGFASRILVGKGKGSAMMDDASTRVVRGVAAGHGLLGLQKQSAYNFLGAPSAIKNAGAVQLRRAKPIEGEELRLLQDELAGAGADIAQADPRGARALLFDTLNKDQVAGVRSVAKKYGAEPEFMARDGDVFPRDDNFNAPEKWSAQPYIDEIRASGLEAGFDATAPAIARDLRVKSEQLGQQFGLTSAPWYGQAMKAIETGGLKALQKLVDAGVVPVMFLSLLGGGAAMALQGEEEI